MNFGEWLKKTRKKMGISQEKLAELADVGGYRYTGAYISNIERGYDKNKKNEPTRPDKDLVISIAKVLNADVDAALILAGHAPISEIKTIRNRILVSDFDDFDDKDLDDIAEYIALKKLKNKGKEKE